MSASHCLLNHSSCAAFARVLPTLGPTTLLLSGSSMLHGRLLTAAAAVALATARRYPNWSASNQEEGGARLEFAARLIVRHA